MTHTQGNTHHESASLELVAPTLGWPMRDGDRGAALAQTRNWVAINLGLGVLVLLVTLLH